MSVGRAANATERHDDGGVCESLFFRIVTMRLMCGEDDADAHARDGRREERYVNDDSTVGG